MKLKIESVVPGETIAVQADKKDGHNVVLITAEDPSYLTETWLTPREAHRLAAALETFASLAEQGVVP